MTVDLERRIEAYLKREEADRTREGLKRMAEDINKNASKPIIIPGLTIPRAMK